MLFPIGGPLEPTLYLQPFLRYYALSSHVTQKGQGHDQYIWDLKAQNCDPNMLRAQYLKNGWKLPLGSNRPPIGTAYGESNGHVINDVT